MKYNKYEVRVVITDNENIDNTLATIDVVIPVSIEARFPVKVARARAERLIQSIQCCVNNVSIDSFQCLAVDYTE